MTVFYLVLLFLIVVAAVNLFSPSRKVKFKLKINKSPGIFSAGNYDLKITASCTEEFSDFKFKFFDGYNEDYTTLDISYVKNGKLVKKAFKTDAWY